MFAIFTYEYKVIKILFMLNIFTISQYNVQYPSYHLSLNFDSLYNFQTLNNYSTN